ncbi:MAG: hypothetical protein AAFQ90_12785 [Pseudomonadota bacterium]
MIAPLAVIVSLSACAEGEEPPVNSLLLDAYIQTHEALADYKRCSDPLYSSKAEAAEKRLETTFYLYSSKNLEREQIRSFDDARREVRSVSLGPLTDCAGEEEVRFELAFDRLNSIMEKEMRAQ